jgi:hypothetical protein
MINRINRNIAGQVLRRFMSGEITNDEFDAQCPRNGDAAIQAIWTAVWMVYSDLYCHKLTGSHTPDAEIQAALERSLIFLGTDLEFEWPLPVISVGNVLAKLWRRLEGSLGGSPPPEAKSPRAITGDDDVWPFFRRADYERCVASRPKTSGVAHL